MDLLEMNVITCALNETDVALTDKRNNTAQSTCTNVIQVLPYQTP